MATMLCKSAMSALLLSATMLSACTTRLSAAPDLGTAGPTEGIPYRLPMRQFTAEVTWTLSDCNLVPGDTPDTLAVTIDTDKEVELSSELVEGEALVLDYQAMANHFKTSALTVDFWEVGEGKDKRQTRFVKSVNAEIAGQEGEALKAGIKAIGSLASIGLRLAGLPAAGAGPLANGQPKPKPQTPEVICDPNLKSTLAELKGYKGELKGIAKRVEQITTRLIVLKGRVVGERLTDEDMKELAALQGETDKLAKRKETIEENSKALAKQLTFKKKFVFADFDFGGDQSVATRKIEARSDLLELYRAALVIDNSHCNPDSPQCKDPENYIRTLLKAYLKADEQGTLTARLTLKDTAATALTPAIRPLSTDELRRSGAFNGFVYREPVRAHLAVELTLPAPPPPPPGSPAAKPQNGPAIAELDETVPQFGRLRVLPLRSRWGEKNNLAADFAADGTPIKISYKALEAAGPKMIEAVGTFADESGKIVDRVVTYREDAKKKEEGAELQAIKDRIELLTEQQKLAKLEAQPSVEEAAQAAELALLRYQKERAELLAAIRKAND